MGLDGVNDSVPDVKGPRSQNQTGWKKPMKTPEKITR